MKIRPYEQPEDPEFDAAWSRLQEKGTVMRDEDWMRERRTVHAPGMRSSVTEGGKHIIGTRTMLTGWRG